MIEVPISEIKLKAYGISRDEAVRRATEAIGYASEHGIRVAFFGVDGTRAPTSSFSGASTPQRWKREPKKWLWWTPLGRVRPKLSSFWCAG